MLWDPVEFGELNALSKTDPRLKRRMEIVFSFLQNLDPQFDQAFWTSLATIPESHSQAYLFAQASDSLPTIFCDFHKVVPSCERRISV